MKKTHTEIEGNGEWQFGFAARFLLRSTPLPELLRYRLESRFESEFQFLEDFRLPPHIRSALNSSGLLSHDHGNFFMLERHEIRMGIIVGKPLNRDDGSESPVPLRRDLARFLDLCRSDPRGVQFYPAEGIPGILTPSGIRRPLLIVVWARESPPLEQLLGSNTTPSLLEKWSRHLRTLQSAFPESPDYEADTAMDGRTTPVREAVDETMTETRAAETVSPASISPMTTPDKSWRDIGLHIVGSGRGARRRRMLVRKRENTIRLILQNMESGNGPADSARFFKHLDEAENVVRAHRELFNTSTTEFPASFSLQIEEDYTFQSLACGNRPLLWRSKSRHLYLFPDSRTPSEDMRSTSGDDRNRSRIIKGGLASGDALLFFPEPLTSSEMNELEKAFQMEGALCAPIIERFLNNRAMGKTLILRRS